MIDIICDNKETERVLHRLYKQVIENGGIVHDKLTISSKNGDFQITAAKEVPEGEEIIILPKSCLLPIDKYKLDLDGYKIVMISHDDDITDGQVAMMKTMLELFNLTGKIEAQMKTSTFSLYYKDQDLLNRILKSRSKHGVPFFKGIEEMNNKTYYLDSFLKTRTLAIQEADKKSGTKVLMPIIDCLNHHAKAIRFISRFPDANSSKITYRNDATHITVLKSCPVQESKECYVNYGPYDSMDSLIQYNYADEYAIFVRSVPIKIDLPDEAGVIVVQSMTWNSQHKDLPEDLKDLEFYLPPIRVDKKKKSVSLSFLFIPPNTAPRAMRRVLTLALSRLELNLDNNDMLLLLQLVERRVIEKNITYFEELSEYLKTYKPTPDTDLIVKNLNNVVSTQLRHTKSYQLLNQSPMSVS